MKIPLTPGMANWCSIADQQWLGRQHHQRLKSCQRLLGKYGKCVKVIQTPSSLDTIFLISGKWSTWALAGSGKSNKAKFKISKPTRDSAGEAVKV
jgi:hypothetical protein